MKYTKNILFILIALALNSCQEETPAVSLEIFIKNNKFIPSEVTAPSNKRIKLIIHNQDNSVEEFESLDLNREKIIPSNSKATLFVGPLKPGKYNFFGEFHMETAQGTLVVKEDSK